MLLTLLACALPLSHFLQDRASSSGLAEASRVVSLLSLVMGIAFLIGAAYSVVAISAQTQLQEDLPEDVRGRVFGVLNMLVSVASLSPILIVGPLADIFGREPVIFVVGLVVCLVGAASIVSRRPGPLGDVARAPQTPSGAPVDPMTAATSPSDLGVAAAPATAAPRPRQARRRRGDRAEDDGAS